jgi:hypothetical protein
MVRASLHVNTNDRLGQVARGIEAVVTEVKAKLIFTLGAKTAVAFVTGGVLGPLKLLTHVNFGMNFRMNFSRNHNRSPKGNGQMVCHERALSGTEDTALSCFAPSNTA